MDRELPSAIKTKPLACSPKHIGRVVLCAVFLSQSGCGQESTSYFPLTPDRSWHYHIERTTMDGQFSSKHVVETLPSITWQGQKATPKASAGGTQYLYRQQNDRIVRVATRAPGDSEFKPQAATLVVLPESLTLGATWTQSTHSVVLENTGPPWETLFRITTPVEMHYEIATTTAVVTVPAGRFEKCLQVIGSGTAHVEVGNYIGRTEVTIKTKEWYAPGVGLVKSERKEATGAEAISHGKLIMELEHFST